MSNVQPFHLAIPVAEIQETRTFYREVIGCTEGRSSDHWVDLDFFGHQLVLHVSPNAPVLIQQKTGSSQVDGHAVPVPHFGVVLKWNQWHIFAERLKSHAVTFAIEPYLRFEGQPGEQATLFFYDPSGNALEFKAFKDMRQLFAS